MRFDTDKLPLQIGAVIFALVGALALWGAWALNKETSLFRDHGVHTQGIVFDYQDSTTSSYPLIRFTDQKGAVHEFKSDNADDPLQSPVGDPIAIVYLPEDLAKVRLDTWDALGGGDAIVGGFGLAFVAMGALIWFVFAPGRGFSLAVGFPLGWAVFASLIGLVTWAVSGDSLYLTAQGSRTTAVVVNAQGSALVEYTVNGKVYQNQTHVGDQKHPLAIGDKLPLLYDPHKPGRARVDTFDQLWFATLLTGGFTALCLLVALGSGIFFFLKRKTLGKLRL